jgi:hypothetical protein
MRKKAIVAVCTAILAVCAYGVYAGEFLII